MDFRPKCKTNTLKLLEENTERTLFDINHSNIFLDLPPRVMKIKTKTNGTQLNVKVFSQQRKP